MNENEVLLTRDEAYAVCDVFSMSILDMIRNDPELDSLQWLRNAIHGYEKLCGYSGYIGVTEDDPNKKECYYQ